MNNKYLIILFIIPAIILCNPKKNNKKDKTIINDGINYKINNSSNHISPLKEFKKIEILYYFWSSFTIRRKFKRII